MRSGRPARVDPEEPDCYCSPHHVWFYIDVADEKTKRVDNWEMEMNSPNSLIRLGWSRHSMFVGDMVTVEGASRATVHAPAMCEA